MIALSVAAAAGLICRAMENGERTPAGWAAALEAACMLQTPETAQRLIRAEQRRAELEAVLGSHRKDDQAEIGRLKARIAELEAELRIGSPWKCDVCGKDNRRDVCVICETDRPEPRERTVDEDPIAFALTEKAADVVAEATVTRSARKLRDLLAGQRDAVAEAGERP